MSPARPAGKMKLADCLSDGVAIGALAAVECGRADRHDAGSERRGRAGRRHAAVAREGQPREGLRGFPERRHREGHRARQSGRLPLGRAPEALHHARHGDRPGQGRERHRPCDPRRGVRPRNPRGRHHDLSAALRAGELRRDERASSRQGFPPDAPAALASMGGRAGRGVRRVRRLAARAILSARGREGLARDRQPRSARRRAAASACATSRRSARSRSKAPTRRRSSTASTPTRSPRCRSARRATA